MSSVTLVQTLTRAVDDYSVKTRVDVATGLPPEIFVYSYTGEYSHVVADDRELVLWPITPTPGVAFYRQREVVQTFTSVTAADQAAATHKSSVSRLVYSLNLRNRVAMVATLVTVFDGQTTVTYTSN